MRIVNYRRSTGSKTVIFADATDVPVADLKSAAMAHAHERPGSLFGTNVVRHDNGTATVVLFTD